MARVALVGRSASWQLLLLLLSWTTFICCLLYASRMDTLPATSGGNSGQLGPSRAKRFSTAERQGQCLLLTQTKEDKQAVEYVVNRHKRRSDLPTVHCSVTSTCNKTALYQADCHCTICGQFRLRVKDGDTSTSTLSTDELSQVVSAVLVGKSFTTLDDLNDYIDVQCADPFVPKLKITGDVLSNPGCGQTRRSVPARGQTDKAAVAKNIHIVFFRFLSQWEFPIRFPSLYAFLESGRKGVRVVVLDKHQATQWNDDEVLSLFLQGHHGSFNYTRSLSATLNKAGYCFRLRDLSCSHSHQQGALVRNVTSAGEGLCESRFPSARGATLGRLCQDGNLTDSETRETLTSLLLHEHGQEGSAVPPRPLVSVSVLNTKDFKNPDVVDAALRNVLVSLLTDPDRIVMLVSGVGNPAFLRLDHSVRLLTQASNPVLLLASSGDLSQATHAEARQLNQSLFSMKGVHHFVSKLPELENHEEKFEERFRSPSRDLSTSCRSLNVSPPFSCLCEGQLVRYQNDTLMAGFAELAVSLINSQLQQSHPPPRSALTSPRCPRWRGLSFTDVQVGRHEGKKRILMDLRLGNELTKDVVFGRAALDMWDTDKVPQAQVRLYDNRPSAARDDRLWRTLCVAADSLDESLLSEVNLLKRWSHERHFGHKAIATHVHDTCLYLLLHDFGDSIGVQAANACRDRRYDVTLPLSLVNMVSLTPFPLSASLGHAQREFLAAIVKVSYTVPTFAYKLFPDFDVFYDD